MAEIAGYRGEVYFPNGLQKNAFSWTMEEEGDTYDVTDFDSGQHRQYIPGCLSFTASIDYYCDTDEEPPKPGVTEADLRLYVDEHTYFGGFVIITGVSPEVDIDDAETITIECQGSGAWVHASYSTASAPDTLVTLTASETVTNATGGVTQTATKQISKEVTF